MTSTSRFQLYSFTINDRYEIWTMYLLNNFKIHYGHTSIQHMPRCIAHCAIMWLRFLWTKKSSSFELYNLSQMKLLDNFFNVASYIQFWWIDVISKVSCMLNVEITYKVPNINLYLILNVWVPLKLIPRKLEAILAIKPKMESSQFSPQIFSSL